MRYVYDTMLRVQDTAVYIQGSLRDMPGGVAQERTEKQGSNIQHLTEEVSSIPVHVHTRTRMIPET